ncbi:MAG: 3-dehydroquinate synthase [Flavobacteriales bacterium]|nr:3-dehydroquinate synthase [Flavobacteriales bacterium]MCB9194491.1 3-dehydroquinate synthase [Flavobacteriales bacterium]
MVVAAVVEDVIGRSAALFVPLDGVQAGAKVAMAAGRKGSRTVQAAGSPVVLGPAALKALETWLNAEARHVRHFVIGDENTLRHCLPELQGQVPPLREARPIAMAAGERAKSIEVCHALWSHLADQAADRQAVLVALGGGVVSDVVGFVGATYKRGIRVVNVPTSLMGMVDAAIGGKNGIDLDGIKNIVGTIRQPAGTYVHVPFLRTLGKRELMNGVAEMLKHGLVRDRAHWSAVCAAPLHDLKALEPLVQRSAEIKAGIVEEDPNDLDTRRLLNFGHTIGHAIEARSWESPQRALLHGEAVAIGMICEAWLSWKRDLLSREALDEISRSIQERYRPHPLDPVDHHRILQLMANDKKNADERFRFTLLEDIGHGRINVEVTAAQVTAALDHYRLLMRDGPKEAV